MSQTIVDQIIELIHEDILSLSLAPGQRLHIADLAKAYGVGSGPVREALSRLVSTELVVIISQCGFRVADMSIQDLHDIYQTRAQIEIIALKRSIQLGNDEWEAGMLSSYHLLAKFETEATNTSYSQEWERKHRAFNLSLINACGLQHLLSIQKHLYQLTLRYRRLWLNSGINEGSGLRYAKESKKIMDAALARDPEQASRLLEQHFEKAVKVIAATTVFSKL